MAQEFNQTVSLPRTLCPIVAIGVGGIVRDAHWPAYQLAGFQVHSAFDPHVESARRTAAAYGVPLVFEGLDELIAAAPGDAIFDVAVPASAIAGILEKLPEGAFVLVQKPLGEDLRQAVEIQEIVRRRGLQLAVNFQLRTAPYAIAARSIVEAGLIGEIAEIDVRVNVATPWDRWDFLEKAARVEIVYHSIHYVDFIRSMMGEPQAVQARTIKSRSCPKLDSTRSSIVLDYGEFARANVFTNHNHSFGTRHQESYIRIEGEKGCIKFQIGLNMDYPKGSVDYLEYTTHELGEWVSVPLVGSWFPHAFIGPMAHLMRLREDPGFVVPTRLEDALRTMELVELCYQSSAERGLAFRPQSSL